MKVNYFELPSVNRDLYHNFPDGIRAAYQKVVANRNLASRHKNLLHLAEQSIKFFSLLAFSDYRSQNFLSPRLEVENTLGKLPEKMSLGHYLQLFRSCVGVQGLSVFDEKALSQTEDLSATQRFLQAIKGIENSIKLGATNLEQVVVMALDQNPKRIRWSDSWEHFVSYRNMSEGHPIDYKWPIDNEQYYDIMTPLLESSIIELLTSSYMKNIIETFPIGKMVNTERRSKTYHHSISTEDAGIPIDIVVEMDRPATDIWNIEDWKARKGSSLILKKTGSGGYSIHALFARLGDGPPPKALSVKSADGPSIQSAPVKAASHVPWARGVGNAVGTCGELAQGFLSDGTPFHVTAPITKTSTVVVRLRPAKEFRFEGFEPEHKKMRIACRRALELFGSEPVEVFFEHWTDLDVGKGMGSSTADILAAARAIGAALKRELTEEQLADLATGIESSDGTMYRGVNAVNHKNGELLHRFDWLPDFTVVICIPENIFNTESANFRGKEALGEEFDKLLTSMKEAAAAKDHELFAACCAKSAQLNQRFLPNPLFSRISRMKDDLGADGLCVGHTGTVVGVLYGGEDAPDRASDALFTLQEKLPDSVRIELTRMTDGTE